MRNKPAQEVLGLRFERLSSAGQVALALALVALWLLGRRYGGFTHDASIYVLQGLRVLDPAAFANDLFFLHGAQDAYTVFPQLYAILINVFGAGNAAIVVTLAGQIAFFAAAAALIVRLSAGQGRWWSLALLAAVSGYYGGVGVFRLAEPFATARTLAEPLVIAALSCTLASRRYAAIALLVAAVLLHPLVAAPGIAAVFLWHAFARPQILWLIPILAALVSTAVLLRPELALRFDAPWLAAVWERSPHLFIAQWWVQDWARLLWGLCATWLAVRFVDSSARRLAIAVAAIALAGVAASWIAVDLLGNALAAGLQLWRGHWLMHFLAIVLVPAAAAGLWRSGNAGRAAAASVAASCCFGRAELPAAFALAAFAVVLDASERRRPGWMGGGLLRLILLGAACAASVGLLFDFQSRLPPVYGAMRQFAWTDYVYAAGSAGVLLLFAAVTWFAAHSRIAYAAAAVAVTAFAVSIAAWDAREPWPRFVDRAGARENPFRRTLPPNAQVFWPGPYGRAWLLLGRPTWYSADQGAGIVFNRQTAVTYAQRKLASAELLSAIENCAMVEQPSCRIDARPAGKICRRADGPNYLVLNARIDGHAAIEWPLPPEIGPGRQSLFLYACDALAENTQRRRQAGPSK